MVPSNSRKAVVDTVLPMGGGEDGKSPIFVPKNQSVQWSVWAMHRRKDFYGEDAEEFKPERWETLRPGWVRYLCCRNVWPRRVLITNRNTCLLTADPGSALAVSASFNISCDLSLQVHQSSSPSPRLATLLFGSCRNSRASKVAILGRGRSG